MAGKERNYNIDLLKVFACIAVVGLHTLHKDISVINSTLYYLCGFAVPVFFVSSGYFLLNRGAIPRSYSEKKILAVLRIVVLWCMGIFAAEAAAEALKGQLTPIFLLELPKLIVGAMLQKKFMWQMWYLGALVIIYFLLPCLSRIQKRTVLLIAGGIGILLQMISYFCGFPLQSRVIQTFRLWTWLFYFFLGGILPMRQERWEKRCSLKVHGGIVAAVSCGVLLFQNYAGRNWLNNLFAEYFYDDVLTIAWVYVLSMFVLRFPINAVWKRPISELADLTLGIYIVHPILLRFVSRFWIIQTTGASLVLFAVILICSAVIVWSMKRIPFVRMMVTL